MSVERGRDDELLPVAAGAVLAEFMGYCLTGPIGPWAATLVGASLTPGMSRLMVNVVAEWRARFVVVAEAAQSAAGLSQDELLETFADRPDLQPLLERVASAVKNTRLEPKLRILGTILGESIDKRPTEVDISMLLAATIDDLEAPHLRVIAILAVDLDPGNPGASWGAEQIIAKAQDLPTEGVQAALGGLIRHGLAQTTAGYGGGTQYKITEYGHALLHFLQRIGESAAVDG